MKASELFGVVIRTIGFLVILYSLYDFLGGFDSFFENLLQSNQDGNSASASTLSYFVFGVPEFIAGVLCFFLADWIVELAYRDHSS
jgi:flagellar biosynthesis protein FlhB